MKSRRKKEKKKTLDHLSNINGDGGSLPRDGSKDDRGLGSTFWVFSSSVCTLLYLSIVSYSPFTSIFHAEQMAIYQALIFIHATSFQDDSSFFLILSQHLNQTIQILSDSFNDFITVFHKLDLPIF